MPTETVLITTTTAQDKQETLSTIYTNLTAEPYTDYYVSRDLNSIKVFHRSEDIKVLIRTYIVLIIPVQVDLSPINSFHGNLVFYLDRTITAVENILSKLQSLQGRRQINGDGNDKVLRQLVGSLHETPREY